MTLENVFLAVYFIGFAVGWFASRFTQEVNK